MDITLDDEVKANQFLDRLKLEVGGVTNVALVVMNEGLVPRFLTESVWFDSASQRMVVAPPENTPERAAAELHFGERPRKRIATCVFEYASGTDGLPAKGPGRALQWSFSPTLFNKLQSLHKTWNLSAIDIQVSRPSDKAYEVQPLPPTASNKQRWRDDPASHAAVEEAVRMFGELELGQPWKPAPQQAQQAPPVAPAARPDFSDAIAARSQQTPI